MIPPSINVSEVLNDDRQLRSLIGLGRDEFEKLLNEFTSCLKEDQRKNRKGKPKKTSPKKNRRWTQIGARFTRKPVAFYLILSQKLSDL